MLINFKNACFCILFLFIFLFIPLKNKSQTVYEPIHSNPIYSFLDELAVEKIISLNSCIKPYSRQMIYEKLAEAKNKTEQLNKRQIDELESYISTYSIEKKNTDSSKNKKPISLLYSPVRIQYIDTVLRFFIQPIYGRKYIIGDNKQYQYHHCGGAEMYSYIGKNIGLYAKLTDNYLYKYIFAQPNMLSQHRGGNYKINEGERKGADYSEMTGGITYSWKWGVIGLLKDNIIWGDSPNSSIIFSGLTPTYGMIKLKMQPVKWLDFNYVHAQLQSMVVDSNRSYVTSGGIRRDIYSNKYMAANMVSIMPFKGFNFSFGNSIIYGDKNLQLAYLIPLAFYKSIDHTLTMGTENDNSQLFFNISSRNIKHLHLYGSYFIDEWSIKRLKDKSRNNFTAGKIGLDISNFPIKNFSATFEYYKSMPLTYKHKVETITFESNNYKLGYYLGDNSEEYFLKFSYKPYKHLKASFIANYAQKGNDYDYLLSANVDKYPVMKDIVWSKKEFIFSIDYVCLKNLFFGIGLMSSEYKGYDADGKSAKYFLDKFSSDFFHGKRNYLLFSSQLSLF